MPYKPLIKSRYSSGGNFTRGNPTISHKIWLENYSSEILFKCPRDQLDDYTVILFQYGRFPECMIIRYWRRLWALWKAECIYVYFLGYCSILPVFMDFHMPINPLISFPIKMIYCIIMIFIIFSHNKLSVGFSSALKRNWKGIGIGIDKTELELELLFFIPKELELELNVKELELNWKKGIDPSPGVILFISQVLMVFNLTSQMYHRLSVLVPVLVRVPEYLSTCTSTSMSTITLELTSTSTVWVPEIQYSSTTSTEYEYPSPASHYPPPHTHTHHTHTHRVK